MNTGKKILAVFLAAVALIPFAEIPAKASAPSETADETIYVNLDSYGKPEKVNAVKKVSLNGNSAFTDYGSYEKVTNMTDLTEPEITGQGVKWNLPEKTGTFFYDCEIKPESAALPWNFDVSYQLNGVPAAAENLAGAAGTVEITLKAVPNKKAEDYFKNNMFLEAGTLLDMEDTLSVEAPGSQMQTVGKSRIILFAALPGEEKEFTIRIGTKDFQTDGLFLTMVPGTLSQMNDIKEIKKDKDVLKDSTDAIHDSMDSVLGTIESMSSGLREAQSGLSALEKARGDIGSEREDLNQKADLTLADYTAVAQQTALLIPHLQTAQQAVGDLREDLDGLTKSINAVKPLLNGVDRSIEEIQTETEDMRDVLKEMEDLSDSRKSVRDEIKKNVRSVKQSAADIREDISESRKKLTQIEKALHEMKDLLEELELRLEDLEKELNSHGDFASLFEGLERAIQAAKNTVKSLHDTCDGFEDYLDSAEEVVDQVEDIADLTEDLNNLGDDYFDALEDGAHTSNILLKRLESLESSTQSLLRQGETVLSQAAGLNGTISRYGPEATAALGDTEELARRLSKALQSSSSFLSSFESVMKKSGGNLDTGAQKSLAGMIDTLGKGLNGISQVSVVRKANNTIQNTIDKETKKYEEENNLLKTDAEAKPVSFTSSRNPSPESVQIILRTEEITKKNKTTSTEDLEREKQKMSPIQRMLKVFQKIWQAIVEAIREE